MPVIALLTEVYQMRENLSLLSFWGLVFSLIAVTLFVVIYSYQKSKYANRRIVEDLRQCSVSVYWQQTHLKLRVSQSSSERPAMR